MHATSANPLDVLQAARRAGRLHRSEDERLRDLANNCYRFVWRMLDADIDWSTEDAAKAASAVEHAFLTAAIEAFGLNDHE